MSLITLWLSKSQDVWFAVALRSSGEIVRVGFSPNRRALLEHVTKHFSPSFKVRRNDSEGCLALKVVEELFRGKDIDLLPRINLDGTTKFQRIVYTALMRIPRGKVSTYSMLARTSGCPRGYRAAGNALSSNPIPLIIPCHRVLRLNLKIGGFSIPGVDENESRQLKRRILVNEGVKFEGEKVNPKCLWKPKSQRPELEQNNK
jgi:methylated-DNA-[protein]-cysteine S-methyltransferase